MLPFQPQQQEGSGTVYQFLSQELNKDFCTLEKKTKKPGVFFFPAAACGLVPRQPAHACERATAREDVFIGG